MGQGASTVALAEQGAVVTGIDIDERELAAAREALTEVGLNADLHCLNATDLAMLHARPDQVIFWAALEHMTLEERLESIRAAWDVLRPGGLMTVVETPNRLWPFDSHTSGLPYFAWLPPDLAYRYSGHSERPGFGDRYAGTGHDGTDFLHFLRRGHGVSFHEFAVALEMDHRDIEVHSCMQLERRRSEPYRAIGWRMSQAGRTERSLRSYDRKTHPAWYQPFLYLSLVKGAERPATYQPSVIG